MNRAFLTKLHLAAAAFMFPAVLMFLVTGALYTWGNKGEWHEFSDTVALAQPFDQLDESELRDVAVAALTANDLPEPSGTLEVKGEGADRSLSWTGARSEAAVSAAEDPMAASVEIKGASLHRLFVQLHKAKGSTAFKLYATSLAIVLFLLVISGVVMGLQAKALRKLTLSTSALGLVAFAGFVMLG